MSETRATVVRVGALVALGGLAAHAAWALRTPPAGAFADAAGLPAAEAVLEPARAALMGARTVCWRARRDARANPRPDFVLAQFVLAPAVLVPEGGVVSEEGTRLADVAPTLLFSSAARGVSCDAWLFQAPGGDVVSLGEAPAGFVEVPGVASPARRVFRRAP